MLYNIDSCLLRNQNKNMTKRRRSNGLRPKLLAHRKHTGKLLPAKHTSYPVLLFMLLVVGVLLVGLSLPAQATNYMITGRVAGTPPTQPALITDPTDGEHFTGSPITVSGTCPAATAVELYRNNVFSCSTLCQANGTFSLTTDLFPGANQLQTHVFNLGNTEGPVSPIVTVYYDTGGGSSSSVSSNSGPSSSTSSSTPSTSSTSEQSVQALVLQTNLFYTGYRVGDTVEWKLAINGGVSPYAIVVDWGDGSTSVISQQQAGTFNISHVYSQPGGYHGSYPIKIKASDVNGQQAYLQLFVLVNNPNAVNAIGFGKNLAPPAVMRGIWYIYLVIVLMTLSFWLGERRGVQLFTRHPRFSKLRPRGA